MDDLAYEIPQVKAIVDSVPVFGAVINAVEADADPFSSVVLNLFGWAGVGPAVVHGRVKANGALAEEMTNWGCKSSSFSAAHRGGLSGGAQVLSRMAGSSYVFDSRLQPHRGIPLRRVRDDETVKCRQHPVKLAFPSDFDCLMLRAPEDAALRAQVRDLDQALEGLLAHANLLPLRERQSAGDVPKGRVVMMGKVWCSAREKERWVRGIRASALGSRH
eukprot:TRINITY_DN7255_c0_g1_i2.p1 TRINITY_DN7255_c0_g1~~TRINITY_DN7255_c0_g1_i2.p1  ORF type:complete len:218 (+),score=12.12 TRINITY_DN7255_c0_g1_i2:87-740(+)